MFLAKLSSRVGAGRAKNGWFAGGAEERFFQREKPIVLHQSQSFLTLCSRGGYIFFFIKKTRPKESWDNDGFLTIVYLSH